MNESPANSSPAYSPSAAQQELRWVAEVIERTRCRVDRFAGPLMVWGAVVLVWYPILGVIGMAQLDPNLYPIVSGVAVLIGMIGSAVAIRGARRAEEPDTLLARQVRWTVFGVIVAASIVSVLGPMSGFLPMYGISIVWALAYAAIASWVGLLLAREFLIGGLVIFAAALVAMWLPGYESFVVGPAMGLGMLVPGAVAFARAGRRSPRGA